MKTIIRITNDYNAQLSWESRNEDINYLVNEEIDCFCEVRNDRLINIVEQEKNYFSAKEDYKNKTVIEATGYSQGDWQTYILYHNLDDDNKHIIELVDLLEKSFTHMNDYSVEKFEQTEINGKVFNSESYDYTSFLIRHIEFPEKEDVLKCYNEIYGKDYDECIIEID